MAERGETGEGGPLQILLVGFETTERFRGDIARELAELRGRGLLRVLDARLYHRATDGRLTEVDLNPLLAAPPRPGNPIAHLLGANGGGVIEVFRDNTRNARQVRYINPVPQSSNIFGKVTASKKGGDKLTTITTLLLNGAQNFLAQPPFQVTYQI